MSLTPRCRYKVLLRSEAVPEDSKGRCAALLQLHDPSRSEWQLGKTKVRRAEGRPPPGPGRRWPRGRPPAAFNFGLILRGSCLP